MAISEGLAESGWTNCPPEVRTGLLGLHASLRTASEGAKRHFIYPQVDALLDEWLDHLTLITWTEGPSPAAS